MNSKYYMGIDIGSVSLNIAVIDSGGNLLFKMYKRTNGQPFVALLEALRQVGKQFTHFTSAAVTGSGKDYLAALLNIQKENEIITQAHATAFFHPEIRTAIEIGGQDSKIMFFEHDPVSGKTMLADHALNEVCAAGTGSFLDQQALRLGIAIDEEFGRLALESEKPAAIAGRCSVFAKSDMTHLQQDGEPLENILAGLCFALARNYLGNLVKGRQIRKPVVFQGGVAANKGVAHAFENLLGLKKGELIIPEHYKIMGAIGAALKVMDKKDTFPFDVAQAKETINKCLQDPLDNQKQQSLPKLSHRSGQFKYNHSSVVSVPKDSVDCFVGIDVGASSINIILIDEHKKHLARLYMLKEGSIIDSLQQAFYQFKEQITGDFNIRQVGITGSGRYFIGSLVDADVIVNEITAQAAAAVALKPDVDTVFEIGGQDSKYISIKNGTVTHFEMNKVCAAGTGSFLQEQAGRLDVRINEEFSQCAFQGQVPANLGTKCTVFMESDLIHHQQRGTSRNNLLAGLSYSIVNNFLEKVVGTNDIGSTILFQGGVAGNRSVTAAFENVLDKPVHVLNEHGLTGALGAAIAAENQFRRNGCQTRFKGFSIGHNTYEMDTFICKLCSNECEIKKITVNRDKKVFSGGICERYDNSSAVTVDNNRSTIDGPLFKNATTDLFDFRKKLIRQLTKDNNLSDHSGPVVGMPKILMMYEQLPLWSSFFSTIGINIVLTQKSNQETIHQGLTKVLSETCYPVKLAYGHMMALLEKAVDYLFLPVIIDLDNNSSDTCRNFNCPYVQGLPAMLTSAFASKTRAKFLTPTIYMDDPYRNLESQLLLLGQQLGCDEASVQKGILKAIKVQKQFERARFKKGAKFLDGLGKEEKALIILGKPYNLYDPTLNLKISDKLKKLGIKAIPYDFIDLEDVTLPGHFSNMIWKNEQVLLRSLLYARNDKRLFPVIITNYGCCPDAFSFNYIKDIMHDSPYLILDVDEHSGDAGMVTRIEAFWDTLKNVNYNNRSSESRDLSVVSTGRLSSYGFYKPSRKIDALKQDIYIFNGSYHSDIWYAAAVSSGLSAVQLPMPDDESQVLGKKYTTSRECHPYILLTGDLVKATTMNGFNPDRSAFLMLNYDGSCRMTQYGLSQKLVLKQLGIPQVPVIAPLKSYFTDEVTKLFGMKFPVNLWKGWIASDFLMKKLLSTRPYEVVKGDARAAFETAVQVVASGIINDTFNRSFEQAIQIMNDINTSGPPKPVVGIVGEFYSCINNWANNDIVDNMESLGVEVRLGTTPTDYIIYFNESYPGVRRKEKRILSALYYKIRKTYLQFEKQKIEKSFGSKFYNKFHTPLSSKRDKLTSAYIDPVIDPILTINIAKAKEYALDNCSGIVNLIVLNCLYGNVTSALYRQMQKEHDGIPILTITYDGLKSTNENTRIEAFIHQVKNHHQNHLYA